MEIYNPERLVKERKILLRILASFSVSTASKTGLEQGVLDENFNDFKDVTGDKMSIMTPLDFMGYIKQVL